jgi:hypothetical protein
MTPLPTSPKSLTQVNGEVHLSKRVNVNPLHYATLPLKANWDKVSPAIDQYNSVTRTISILLGAIGVIMMLEGHHWRLPRWPWANDGLSHPKPSFTHDNERYTVEDLAREKLVEVFHEMYLQEDTDDVRWSTEMPDHEPETVIEAEDQFLKDTEKGFRDVANTIGGSGVIPPSPPSAQALQL